MIIDIHAHAFPDELAERAIPLLEEEGDVRACLDGTVSGLIGSMDASGIDAAVVASIATKPSQYRSILEWSLSIRSTRIIPFPSVHPADPDVREHIEEIKAAGFRGIKLHPYYQDFAVDDGEVLPLYAKLEKEGLVLLLHSGFDIAFERYRIADPVRIKRIVQKFSGLKLVAAHFGAWEDWDEVLLHLAGLPVYIDTSYSFNFISEKVREELIERHDPRYILYGSDSPWGDHESGLRSVRALALGKTETDCILGGNATKLLNLE